MGSEGKRSRRPTRKRCDFLVSLPTTGPVRSLNVSVATGVVLFEAIRQRHLRHKPSAPLQVLPWDRFGGLIMWARFEYPLFQALTVIA